MIVVVDGKGHRVEPGQEFTLWVEVKASIGRRSKTEQIPVTMTIHDADSWMEVLVEIGVEEAT